MLTPADGLTGARLLIRLLPLLRNRVTVGPARAELQQRLEHREADFLRLVKRAVFEHPPSAYRSLFRHAGCAYGDLVTLVRRGGVEAALQALLRQGVYLTVDELKGRQPIRRGTETIAFSPEALQNPLTVTHLRGHTSGSGGVRTVVPVDFAFVREWAVDVCLDTAARDGLGWRLGLWMIPGGAAIAMSLAYAAAGLPAARWFSPADPASPAIDARYRWAGRLLQWGGRLAGTPLPAPEFASLEDPAPVLRWLLETRGAGVVPHLLTYVSAGIRLCEAAAGAGLDLSGCHLFLTGEPLTETRAAVVRRTGAALMTNYGSMEAGFIAQGCLAPASADDVHVLRDLVAIVQPPDGTMADKLPPGALFVSSIRPRVPLLLLNVSLGDQAVVAERRCGCPLETLGWGPHLTTIRSFEKLTAAGMTFLDADVVRVLEETLPAGFGGGPTDYQLVEEETGSGQSLLRLLVHPRLGTLDHAAVAETFLSALGGGRGAERLMSEVWRDARLIRIERRPPVATVAGKILHLRAEARAVGDGSTGGGWSGSGAS